MKQEGYNQNSCRPRVPTWTESSNNAWTKTDFLKRRRFPQLRPGWLLWAGIRLQWRKRERRRWWKCFLCKNLRFLLHMLHKHHSEEMFWICLNVRIQKCSNLWFNCEELSFPPMFALSEKSNFAEYLFPHTLMSNENQVLAKICFFISKWFLSNILDPVKPHLCSSSQNIKNTFNGFVLQRICLKLSPKSTSIT